MIDSKRTASEVLQVIRDRRSVRKFDPRPVEREKLLTCIEASCLAPSADNVQPWRFIVVDDRDRIQQLGDAIFSGIYRVTRWAMSAPVIVVLLADLNVIAHRMGNAVQKIPFHVLDIGVAGEHFILQAQSMGLGTCWIGWFHTKKAVKFFHIPKGVRLCQLIAVGYPKAGWRANPRKRKNPLDKIVFFNEWGNAEHWKESNHLS
jgi:nitroreductase